MPLPTPSKGEERNTFISRCISKAVGDGMPQEQAVAACHSTWRRAKGIKEPKSKMNLKFNYQVPIIESAFVNDDFIITGVALNATVTSNNHKFLAEELKKSADTLSGVPLLIDHRNEVEAIKGRVLNGEYNEEGPKVNFRAHVIDETMKGMIKDGRINSVSVGCAVEELEETEDGFFIPRGIEFKELSLVAVAADAGATFDIALQEAYKTVINGSIEESYANAEEVKKAMSKFNKTNFKSNEEKMEARLRILKAGRKFKIDTTEFEKSTSTQTESKYIQQLNISGGKTMESEDTKKLEGETKPEEETKEETEKETEEETGTEEPKDEEAVLDEKLKSLRIKQKQKELKNLQSADEDETVKEPEKPAEEPEKTDEPEDEDEEEANPTDEAWKAFTEKGYKVTQSHGSLKGGSFTLVRA